MKRLLCLELMLALGSASLAASGPTELSLLAPAMPGTRRVETAPPILEITNALEVYGVDYLDQETDRLVAGLFIARTAAGRPFDHNRKTCRLVGDGAVAESVSYYRTEAGFGLFSVLTRSGGQVEHSLQFVMHVEPDAITVDSRYLEEEYPQRPSATETISVQAWGEDIFAPLTLAEGILEIAAGMGPLSFVGESQPRLPDITIRRASHFKDLLEIQVLNNSASRIPVEFEYFKVVAPGSQALRSVFTRWVGPGLGTVKVRVGPLSSVTTYSLDLTGFRDQVFLGRGFGFFADEEPTTAVVFTHSAQDCSAGLDYQASPEFLLMPGCAQITGDTEDFAGIFLPVGSSVGEIIDLSKERIKGVEFWAQAIGEFRFQVEATDVGDFDFHGSNLAGEGVWQRYFIPLDALTQRGFGEPKDFSNQVSHLSWLVDRSQSTDLGLQLSIDGVTLITDRGLRPWRRPVRVIRE